MNSVKAKQAKARSRTIKRPALKHGGLSKLAGFFREMFEFLRLFLFSASVSVAALVVILTFVLEEGTDLFKNYLPQASAQTISVIQNSELAVEAQDEIGIPVRLKIPKLRVNAVIRRVGVAADGSMEVPKVPREAAWYKYGPKPGETGSAVIAGHVNWLRNATGVFERLKILKPGDIVIVQDDKGKSVSFVIRLVSSLGLKDDATNVFVSRDGKSHLNLITCSGVWDARIKRYTKRLVVFADRVVNP